MAFLALHRQGASREAIAVALWPEAPSARPYNTFHATLSRLRRALRQATEDTVGFDGIVLHRDGRYVLDARRVHVDLWALRDQLDRTGGTVPADWTALEEALTCYRGDFAQEVTGVWPEGPREELRREVLDVYGLLARAAQAHDPAHALALLERVRLLDPSNEALYRDIVRTQARLGRPEAISRTLTLLTTNLAEIGEEPSSERDRAASLCCDKKQAPCDSHLFAGVPSDTCGRSSRSRGRCGCRAVSGGCKTRLPCPGGDADTIAYPQFALDIGEMGLHGAGGDDHLCRDLRVRQALRDQADDLPFAGRQRVGCGGGRGGRGEVLQEADGDLGADERVAGHGGPYRFDQQCGAGAFQQEARGAVAQGGVYVVVQVEGGHDHDPGVRGELSGDLQAVEAWHADVGEDDVGAQRTGEVDGVEAVRGLCDHRHVGL
ncbi:hypothetical protein ADK86_35305 [Streptomyces sp. NRRL F-5755]|nr:hypothetical protein ADK86_35305 [Streptomyces sp. NRRL F-5755]